MRERTGVPIACIFHRDVSEERDCQRLKRQRAFSNVCASGKDNKELNGRTIGMKEMILEERQRPRSMDKMNLVIHAIEYRKRNLP